MRKYKVPKEKKRIQFIQPIKSPKEKKKKL